MAKILETAKHQINMLLEEKNFVIVAIDGKCTSGKTTLASKLAELYDCNVFHMDDVFPRPEQRTPERFAEVGEEIQRQRILERPAFLHKRFFEEWIPMENRYFDGFAIPSEAGFII